MGMKFQVHDDMIISKVSWKDLLSSSHTKTQLTELFGEALLCAFNGSDKKVVVVKGTTVEANTPHTVDKSMESHSHEEADSMIPLHVLDTVKDTTVKDLYVSSADTDVLILLMDLVAYGRLGALTDIHFLTGKGTKSCSIDVCERVCAIGQEKCQGLIGLHNFTGADWGGKFVGVSKKSWISKYLGLEKINPIINTFRMLGSASLSSKCLVDGELPEDVRPLENFVCSIYSSTGSKTLPQLRWELFKSKNLEGEKLPPTHGTLLPHILRSKDISMRDKGYTLSHPNLPPLEDNGWLLEEGQYKPVKSLNQPAQQSSKVWLPNIICEEHLLM